MTVRDFIECNGNVRVRWFDRLTGERLIDAQMPNESKHHFRDRKIDIIYRSDDEVYTLDVFVHPNVKEDIWLRRVCR